MSIQKEYTVKGDQRQLALPGYGLTELVAEAVDFLRQHEPPEGFFVGFSGGKDSIVTLELCRMAGVRHQAFYSCTRIDPPEAVRFIRQNYPSVTWLYPKMTMWEGILKKSPPLRTRRWCCDVLKKEPSRHIPLKMRVMGIRAEESARRASRPRICTFGNQTHIKPIFAWPEWAIWEFIESMRLPYPPLYDEDFGRIGCIICPFILGKSPGAAHRREISMHRWPGIWKAYKSACRRWFEHRAENSERIYISTTFDDYWKSYLVGFEDRPKGLQTTQGDLLI